MNVFKVKYETEEDGDLYAISIVDSPANGFDFVAMEEQKQTIKLAANEKEQILYGIVLRADQQIYREFEDGTPFMLTFDAPTIKRLSQDFMRKGYQSNSTYNHLDSQKLSGTTVVENWIVRDKTNDMGNVLGLPVETGDWCIGMKLSDELWVEYIETGLAKGFSIDSFVKFEKIAMNKIETPCENCLTQDEKEISRENNKEENMSMLKKLIKLFSEGEVTLASLETELGTLTADAFEVGIVVYDADLNPVLDGEFTAEGKKYYTDRTGAITEVEVLETEEVEVEDLKKVEDKVEMEEVETEIVAEVMIVTEDIAEEVLKPIEEVDVEALKEKIATLTAEVEKLTNQQEQVLMENTQLKEMAASTKLKAEVVKGSNPITMKAKEVSDDSTLSAIERITKKINN
jgi:FtsZ-binding cell division protein ZapB